MSDTKVRDMTKGSPMKLLLLFSLPVLLGNVFQQLYNMVDTIIVGQYLGYQALATVISQLVSGVCCLFYIWKKYPILHLAKKDFKAPAALYRRHLNIGLPMAFQFCITAIGTVVVQGALNLFGTAKIAAFTAACKAEQLVTQPALTFGVAMANYSGQNMGAGRTDRIKEGVAKCTMLTLICAVISMVILFVLGEPITKLFLTSEEMDASVIEEILASARLYLRQAAIFFPFLNMIFVYRNVLQGIGRSFMPLMGGVFELITRVLASFILPGIIGFRGICLAGPLAWISAAVPLGIAYYYMRKRNFYLPENVK